LERGEDSTPAAARPEVSGSPAFALTPISDAGSSDGAPAILEAHELVFRYRARGAPESGLLLLRGLDRETLGAEGWRRRVVAAPQFHENHVLTETFNLLMGRRWPPQPADVEAAESVCRELGLDDLLARMPAGLLQLVGETGWQLSHGERSRLYMARALLQGTDLVILDESFAALDPETLHRCLRCVLKRAATVLVIAHP
jgi:ATP-binding cassette, subfamily B, bacterial